MYLSSSGEQEYRVFMSGSLDCSQHSSCYFKNISNSTVMYQKRFLCTPHTFSACEKKCPEAACQFVKNIASKDHTWLQIVNVFSTGAPSSSLSSLRWFLLEYLLRWVLCYTIYYGFSGIGLMTRTEAFLTNVWQEQCARWLFFISELWILDLWSWLLWGWSELSWNMLRARSNTSTMTLPGLSCFPTTAS